MMTDFEDPDERHHLLRPFMVSAGHLLQPCYPTCIPLSMSHDVQEAVTIGSKMYCQQDKPLRTFLHDIAAAVPVCVVLALKAWDPLTTMCNKGSSPQLEHAVVSR